MVIGDQVTPYPVELDHNFWPPVCGGCRKGLGPAGTFADYEHAETNEVDTFHTACVPAGWFLDAAQEAADYYRQMMR